MTDIPLYSPFTQWCNDMDMLAINSGLGLQYYYDNLLKIEQKDSMERDKAEKKNLEIRKKNLMLSIEEQMPLIPKPAGLLAELLVNDWIYREQYGINFICSFGGEQGTLKSLAAVSVGIKLGNIYGKEFDLEKQIYPSEETFIENVRAGENRTTHMLDEQTNRQIGLGSGAVLSSMADFEDKCRGSMKNLLYLSPKVKEYHSHYVIFKSIDEIERVHNTRFCDNCPKEYREPCMQKRYETNCPPEFNLLNGGKALDFWERTGYPVEGKFLVETKRKMDDAWVPRGYIYFPMPTPEFVLRYQAIKDKNLVAHAALKESDNAFNKITVGFMEEYLESLYRLGGSVYEKVLKDKGGEIVKIEVDNRHFSPISVKVIEAYLDSFIRSKGSSRRFTTKEMGIMASMVKEKVFDLCQKKNVEMRLKKN